MDDQKIKRVVIVGASIAGWMSGAFLAQMLGPSVSICLIDLKGCDDDLVEESTSPPIKAMHNALGITENDVLSQTGGTLKLCTQFVNWGRLGNRYFHPYGQFGAEFDVIALHQWWLKEQSIDPQAEGLDTLTMAGALANEGRFAHPVPDRRLIGATYDYAYHLDGMYYRDYLASLALKAGVRAVQSDQLNVVIDPDTGFVASVGLDGDRHETGDLYLDCTGAKALLLRGALNGDFEDWSGVLPCDTAISMSTQRGSDFSPLTRCVAREAGWQWRIPLQHATRSGYVYSASFTSNEDATSSLMENLEGRAMGDPVVTRFKNGRARAPFTKNVVALGGAAGFLEPLEPTNLHLLQSGLFRLLSLWPTARFDDVIAQTYNDVAADEWALARDFLVLHYYANDRTDSAFWRACSQIAIPDTLQRRLDHWRVAGRLVSPRPEVFQSASWLSVLVGQGCLPDHYDPLVDAREERVPYQARLAGLRKIIAETATQMPLHADWIAKNCRSNKT